MDGFSTLGSNNIEIKHIQNRIPDNILKAFLHPTESTKVSIIGPIAKKDADAPIARTPSANERRLSKYMLTIRKQAIRVKVIPTPYIRDREKNMNVTPVAQDVMRRAAAHVSVPIV